MVLRGVKPWLVWWSHVEVLENIKRFSKTFEMRKLIFTPDEYVMLCNAERYGVEKDQRKIFLFAAASMMFQELGSLALLSLVLLATISVALDKGI